VPANHPLRPIRQMVNAALVKMDALFSGMSEADIKGGRPSIAPEKLLRAMLLQVFHSVRSECARTARTTTWTAATSRTRAAATTRTYRTDADARLYCKGDNASRLRYMVHTLSDNRHGLLSNAMVTTADGFADREAAKTMIDGKWGSKARKRPQRERKFDDASELNEKSNF